MPEILEDLFNSKTRAKTLKLLFRNPEMSFKISDIAERAKVDYYAARREIEKLKKIKIVKYQKKLFSLNLNFEFYDELKNLVLRSTPISKDKILQKIKKCGRMKLIVLSGVFVSLDNARVDLFLVGDNIRERKLNRFLKDMEAEVGKEINYVIMNLTEFKYRKNMFDKFILETLDAPKEVLWDRIGIE